MVNRRSGLVLLPLLIGTLLSWDLSSRTVCLTEDGVTFIQYARQLDGEKPLDRTLLAGRRGPAARHILDRVAEWVPALPVLEAHDQHPGYPLLILAARRTVGDWLADDPLERWSRSAQLVSVVAGVLLTAGVCSLGRRLLGPAAGFAGAVVVAMSPALVAQRAEALSDVPALACLVASACCAVRVLAAGRARDAALCGLCAGAGYWVRPEAVQVAALLGLFLIVRWWRNQADRPRWALSLCALALPLLLLCGSYMAVRGSVFTKSGSVLVGVNAEIDPLLVSPMERTGTWGTFPGSGRLPPPNSPAGKLVRGAKHFLTGWAHDLGGVTAVPVFLGLWVGRRRVRRHAGQRLILLTVGVNALLLPGVLYYFKGYLDHRHVLPTAALTACWVWPGLRAAVRLALRTISSRSLRTGAATLLTLLALVEIPASWTTTFHGERFGHRLAGEWLTAQGTGSKIFDVTGLAAYYAELEDRNLHPPRPGAITMGYLDALAGCCPDLRLIVISDRQLELSDPAEGTRLSEVVSFPASLDPDCAYRVRIFRTDREGPP